MNLSLGKPFANGWREKIVQRDLKRLSQENQFTIRDKPDSGFDSGNDVPANVPPKPLASGRKFRLRQTPPKAELPYLRSNNVTGRSNVPSHPAQNKDFSPQSACDTPHV